MFSFAGIHEQWVDKETGEELRTFSILTRAAGPLLASIHNSRQRQPVILVDGAETAWLDSTGNRDSITELFAPVDDAMLQATELLRIE
jgi:putative SOS response-associated peptidase YedK